MSNPYRLGYQDASATRTIFVSTGIVMTAHSETSREHFTFQQTRPLLPFRAYIRALNVPGLLQIRMLTTEARQREKGG